MKFQFIDYELIPDEYGGYEVNQSFATDEYIDIKNDNVTDKEIIQLLKKEFIIRKTLKDSKFDIDGEFDYTLYFNYCGNPAFELRRVEEEN